VFEAWMDIKSFRVKDNSESRKPAKTIERLFGKLFRA
jgi:hypothetical protein